jgi:hypothetical protein
MSKARTVTRQAGQGPSAATSSLTETQRPLRRGIGDSLQTFLAGADMLRFRTGRQERPRRELLWASLLFGALVGGVYIRHVIRGGWYQDDWTLVASLHLRPDHGLFSTLGTSFSDYRPGVSAAFAVLYIIGGTGQAAYLVAGVVLTTLECILFYTALRLLRIRPLHAGSAAGLLAVAPFVDATRLWFAAFPATIAVCLFLAGLNAALHGLQTVRPRRRVAWHALALSFYVAAGLTYELVIPLVCVAAVLYAVAGGWRAALRRLRFDLLAAGVSILVIAHRVQHIPQRHSDISLHHFVDRAKQMWPFATQIFRYSLPLDKSLAGPLGVALVLACAIGAGRALERGPAVAAAIRTWGLVALAGLGFSLLGFVMLLPADPFYVPRWDGLDDRVSAVAVLGAVVLLVALAWLFGLGIAALLRRPRLAAPIALIAIAMTGVSLARQELRNQNAYAESWKLSQRVVSDVRDAMGPNPPQDSAIVTFRHPVWVFPGNVPVFAATWDLDGAMKLAYDDPTILARPFQTGAYCDAAGIQWVPYNTARLRFPTSEQTTLPYGKLWFVDAEHRKAVRIENRRDCQHQLTALGAVP